MYQHTKHLKADKPQSCDRCGGIIQQGDPIHETITIEGDVMTVTIMHDDEYIACDINARQIEEFRRDRLDERVAKLDHDRIMALELAHQAREEAREAQEIIDQIWLVINSLGVTPYNSHRHMIQAIRALLEGRT